MLKMRISRSTFTRQTTCSLCLFGAIAFVTGLQRGVLAGPVSSSPPAVVVDAPPSESSYGIAAQPLKVGITPVSVPMQLQQPTDEAARVMAQIVAREQSSVLKLPDPSTGLQLPSAYQRAALDAVSYVDLSEDAQAPRPVVPLPASAWSGLAAVTMLLTGLWLRKISGQRRRVVRVRH